MQSQPEMDAETAASGSTLGFSDLSAMENETDDFGRRILQHQRYSTGQPSGNLPQPFSRARPRKADSLTIGTIVQNVKDEHHHRRTASDGNAAANLSLNVPKEWGRRARRRPDWLRSYESDDTPTSIAKVDDEDAILPRRTAFTGDESPILQRSATRERIVQSTEQHSPSVQRVRGSTSPWSMKHMNTTLQSSLDVDEPDQDFTDASLLTSTPAGKQRDYKQNGLTRHEIMLLEERGVTRKTLDQISERSHDLGALEVFANTGVRNDRPTRRRRSGVSDKENEPLAQDEDADSKSQRSSGSSAPFPEPKNTRSYSHARQDSIALLRKLARVTSLSPSPARATANDDPSQSRVSRETKDHMDRGSSEPAGENLLPGVKREPCTVRDTSAPESRSLNIGAGTTGVEQTKSYYAPAKSALEDVLREAKEVKNIQLGESTLASLEDIVHPGADLSDAKPSVGTSGIATRSSPSKASRFTAATSSTNDVRHEEDLALRKLNQSLRTTRTNIKDASKGLRRIEDKIEAGQWEPSTSSSSAIAKLSDNTQHHAMCQHCGGRQTSAWQTLWSEFQTNFYTWDRKRSRPLQLTWLGLACLLWITWYLTETTLCAYYCHQTYAVEMVGYGVDPDAPDYPFVIPTLLFRPFEPIWRPVLQYLAWSFGVLLNLGFGEGLGAGASSRHSARGPKARPVRRTMGTGVSLPGFAKAVDGNAGWLSAAASATTSVIRNVAASTLRAGSEASIMWEDEFLSGT